MSRYQITIATANKPSYKYIAIGFQSSAEALLNAMKVLQGDVPRLMRVEVVK